MQGIMYIKGIVGGTIDLNAWLGVVKEVRDEHSYLFGPSAKFGITRKVVFTRDFSDGQMKFDCDIFFQTKTSEAYWFDHNRIERYNSRVRFSADDKIEVFESFRSFDRKAHQVAKRETEDFNKFSARGEALYRNPELKNLRHVA